MENLSNNNLRPAFVIASAAKQSNNNSNSRWLLLLLFFIFHFSFLKAQNAYNKLYTLQARGSMFNAIAPHGNFGGCMAAATVVDSSTGIQAIRIARFDALGNLQASNYFNIPDDTARTLFVNYKAITRVHDNCYAIVGSVLPKLNQYSFILLADSNGVVYKYKDLISRDTFFDNISTVQYDGLGHIIACGHYTNSKALDSSYGVIYKFDTALNRIWLKQYHPSGILVYPSFFSLTVDSSGFTMGGGAQNSGINSFKGYKCQSLILKTDTAGTLQWVWASPAVFYKDYQSFIGAVLHTKDGGYLFTTEGHTYNSLYPADPDFGIRLNSKKVIVKLDAARNKQWEIVVDDYFSGIGYSRSSLIEFEDSSFLYLGGKNTDSLGPNLIMGKLVLQHYSSKGMLLKQRIINKYLPRSVDDTHKDSGGPIYDIKQTADKAFVLCGYYENKTTGATAPAQRGWLLKLDSNLCLGVGDSQCMPSSIIEQPQLAVEAFKVYPNPSTGYITLTSLRDKHGLRPKVKQSETINTKVFDLLGRIVHQQKLSFNNNEAILNLNLPSATYFLELKDEAGNVQRERIVIQ